MKSIFNVNPIVQFLANTDTTNLILEGLKDKQQVKKNKTTL